MAISKPMSRLRRGLDALSIDYNTSDYESDFGTVIHHEQTVWNRTDGYITSVIYVICHYSDGKTYKASHGLPNQLECWKQMDFEDPVGMDVIDILKLADETGVRK